MIAFICLPMMPPSADNGKEILSMNEVLAYLLRSSVPLLEETELAGLLKYDQQEWQNLVDQVRGMLVTYPGKVNAFISYTFMNVLSFYKSYLQVSVDNFIYRA